MKLRLFLLFSACLAEAWPLQAQSPPIPEIRSRMEYEFQTVAGQAYLVEGTVDGETWQTMAGPIFGDGQVARAMLPTAEIEPQREYRVRPVAAAAILPATTALGGKTIALNDNGQVRQLIFFPAIQGVTRGILKTDKAHARSFIWEARRLNQGDVVVDLLFSDATKSTVNLSFSNQVLGTYQMRDQDRGGRVQVVEAGVFSVHSGRIRDNEDEAVLPHTLEGRSLGFEEGGELTRMEFTSEDTVVVTKPDGSEEIYSYRYDKTATHSAVLKLENSEDPEKPEKPSAVFEMALDTQATGTFSEFPELKTGEVSPGAVPRLGNFNVPTTPKVVNSVKGSPTSLDGKVIHINGNDPATLKFNGDGTGTATREKDGSVEVTPFTYDYSQTDADEASLALTFPGAQNDRVEDYDLDFSESASGSFQSSTYQGGELAASASGNFNTGGS